MNKNQLTLNNHIYNIETSKVDVRYDNSNIVLFLDIEATTNDEKVENELRTLRLYHNNGFNTYVSEIKNLKGKHFVWNESKNDKGEEAGYLYVLEHEDVTKGIIEILDIQKNIITIKWSGYANVLWNDEYGENVPFETIFEASIPVEKVYELDAYKSTKLQVNDNLEIEIINLNAFNRKLSRTRNWDKFKAKLKIKITHNNKIYKGNIIFKNGKNNYTINYDKECPINLQFNGFEFNLRSNYEIFSFKITK